MPGGTRAEQRRDCRTARLTISLLTVKAHMRSLYNKLGISSRSAATRYAIEHHLV